MSERARELKRKYKRQNPYCEVCDARGWGNFGKHVSYRVEPAAGGDPLDWDNLIHLCSSHHKRKGGFGNQGMPTLTTIVSGPPGSGKTTFVKNRMHPGDLVFDLDAVYAAISFQPDYVRPEPLKNMVFRVRDTVYDLLSVRNSIKRAWIITSDTRADVRKQLIHRFHAKSIVLKPTPEECKRRISDQGRAGNIDWPAVIDEWFDQFEPLEKEKVIEN